jgi:hypothetical protein
MDLKFALRSLQKNPGFTVLAILVMALGIGANTAVFSVVNTVLLKPLAYRDPDSIVTVSSLWKKSGGHGQASAPDFHDWHDQSTAFSAMAYYANSETAVKAGAAAEYKGVATVTPEFFRVFSVEPVAGRLFTPEEQKPGGGGAVIISQSYHTGRAISARIQARLGRPSGCSIRHSPLRASCRPASISPTSRTFGFRRIQFSPKRHRARDTITWWSRG